MSFDYFYGPDDAEQYSFYGGNVTCVTMNGGHQLVIETIKILAVQNV